MNPRLVLPLGAVISLAFSACAVNDADLDVRTEEATSSVENGDDSVAAELCSSGLSGFQTAFLPKVQTEVCTSCHKGNNPNAPPWLQGQPSQIYVSTKNYVNFADLDHSRLVIRAGNRHCGGRCNDAMAKKMRAYLQGWWDGGEVSCDQTFSLRTEPERVPADLPSDRFVTLAWDLARVDVALRGVKLTVEIRKFTNAEGPVPGSYLIRKPRFVSEQPVSIAVRRVRILNNQRFQEAANQFERIDTVASQDAKTLAYPVLSPEQMRITEMRVGADDLTVAFDTLAKSEPRECRAMDSFMTKVMPAVEARSCLGCHAPGRNSDPAAIARFDMSGDDRERCAKFLERTWSDKDVLPALIDFPLHGRFEHPRVLVGAKDVLPDWTDWMAAEWE